MQVVIDTLYVVSNPSLVVDTTLAKFFFHFYLLVSIMPCKGRNDNIYLKKLIHRVIHSLCITRAKDDVLHTAPRPHDDVFPNAITVAERNGVKVYKPDNNDGAGEERKKNKKKNPNPKAEALIPCDSPLQLPRKSLCLVVRQSSR